MSQYYDLEKASQVLNLSTAEVNRLREQGKIQGFRDGSNWKFKREDVDKYLTQRIKTGSESGEFVLPGDDDDFSLFEKDEDELTPAGDNFLDLTFDDEELPSLMSEGSSNAPQAKSSSLSLSASDSGLSLEDDDNKINIDNDSDFLSLLDNDLSLDLGDADGLSLVSDDEVVLGGKKKEPAKETESAHTDELASLSPTPDDSVFSLELTDETTPAATVSSSAPAAEVTDQDSEVFTLDDDDADSYALTPDDAGGYALADEPAKPEPTSAVATEPAESQSESSFSLADDEPLSQPQLATSSSEIDLGGDDDDDDIFQLADDPTATKAPVAPAAPEPVASSDSDEDFRLDPTAISSDESDSESASQVIAVDDDNLFLQDDDQGNMFAGSDSTSVDASASSDAFAPMDNTPAFSEPLPGDGFGSGFGEPMSVQTDGGLPAADSGGLEFESGPVGAMPVVATEGCSYNAGKGCVRDAKYSGLDVLLLLVPSLIVLIPSAMAVYELVRVIWSWGEPFTLSGTILETVGNLVNLINK